jgi:2-dehydro-3-deoxyphosphogluconate aldolase/(4S)-4-hydroxy-2-oxoglutarate aldolase
MSVHPVVSAIRAQRVVAIIRAESCARAVETGRALFAAGMRAVEVSLTTPGGLDAIAELNSYRPAPAYLGAGTVLTADKAAAAADAGATFLVAPNLDIAVIDQGHRDGLAVIPAASTPTEMLQAQAAGADLIKLFPASLWTPAALADVRAALPQLGLVPTGGVTLGTAPEWIRAGSVAVGLGSALSEGSVQDVAHRAAEIVATLARAAQ